MITRDWRERFFITNNGHKISIYRWNKLGVTWDEYISIIRECRGHWDPVRCENFFHSQRSAQKAIDKLEAIMVMKKLTE